MFGKSKQQKARDAGVFVLAFAAGVLTGAAIALLTAPKSGKQLRKDIGSDVDKFSGKLREKVEAQTDQAVAGIKNAADSIEKAVRKVANV